MTEEEEQYKIELLDFLTEEIASVEDIEGLKKLLLCAMYDKHMLSELRSNKEKLHD